MEGKIITCCGDCVHYDWKKHKCRNGYTDDDNPKKHFYQDCKTFEDLEEHDKQCRADAINEVKKSLKEANYEYDENMSIDDNIGSVMLGEFAKGYNKGYEEKCLKVRADVYAEVDELIAEMAEVAESQMMFRHAEICELIRERIKVICNGRQY